MLKREPGRESIWGEPKGGGGVGQLTQPGQNGAARWAWHSKQECFQTVKREKKKEGGNKREGGRRRGGMRAEGICASLWETLLVLIYTSMTTAQNELTVREQQQPKTRNKKKKLWRKWLRIEWNKEGRWSLLIDILYSHTAKHLLVNAASN